MKEVAQFTPIASSKSGYYGRCRACRARLAWERNHPGRRFEDRPRRQADPQPQQSEARPIRSVRTCTECGLVKVVAEFTRILWNRPRSARRKSTECKFGGNNVPYSTELTSKDASRPGMGDVACAEPNEPESVTGRILTSVSARRRACDAIDSVGRLPPPHRHRNVEAARDVQILRAAGPALALSCVPVGKGRLDHQALTAAGSGVAMLERPPTCAEKYAVGPDCDDRAYEMCWLCSRVKNCVTVRRKMATSSFGSSCAVCSSTSSSASEIPS
jgi:hypothetical protein